jgi:hypothetical protein
MIDATKAPSRTTRGGTWELPLVINYRLFHGPVRPYAGGGMVIDEIPSATTDSAAGGSYGLGKSVLWSFSGLSTVLFNSILLEEPLGRRSPRLIGHTELHPGAQAAVPARLREGARTAQEQRQRGAAQARGGGATPGRQGARATAATFSHRDAG